MSKNVSFIYIDLNSMLGKYAAACLIIGNVVVARKTAKAIDKFMKKPIKKESK